MPYAYRASCEVDAPAQAVWQVLVDVDSYPAWNRFTRRATTSLVVGTPIVMRVHMDGLFTLTQTETVREVTPHARLVWALDIGLPWLIWAERVQTLTPLPGDRTRYETVDTIGGALSPLVHLMFGRAVQTGFDRVAEDLPGRVAAVAASARPG